MTSARLAPLLSAISERVESTLPNWSGLFASQSFCGDSLILAPFAPPLISEPLNVDALAQAVSTISVTERPELLIASLTDAIS